jgi:hypothetical protein
VCLREACASLAGKCSSILAAALPGGQPAARGCDCNRPSRPNRPTGAHPVQHDARGAAFGVLRRLLLVLDHELAAWWPGFRGW